MRQRDTLRVARHNFVVRLVRLQAEAFALGLPITARALHNGPIRAVGWELADDTTKAASYDPDALMQRRKKAKRR